MIDSEYQQNRIDFWEEQFLSGISSTKIIQTMRDSWLQGRVHCFHNIGPQFDPIPIGSIAPIHQILLTTGPPHHCRDLDQVGRVIFSETLYPGDMLIPSPDHILENYLTTWDSATSIIHVNIDPVLLRSACEGIERDYERIEFVDSFPAQDPMLEHVVRSLGTEAKRRSLFGRLYAKQLMQLASIHLLSHYTAQEFQVKEYQGKLSLRVIQCVDEYIEAHLCDDIKLADLAQLSALSEYHFARLFKQTVGIPPHQYIIDRRIERAKQLLRSTD
ncbi:MAG: hypothetical protein GFH27_549331n96 [Chloroflexi bacterium AL-W]|nr:hypothetical protein [Chloroflexi bacterium AL-N1]NOK70396.1 hypothetical protein [Chloroflexi bacterium AL-N10]NOK78074.1 hypothetical protein [Chloroflexi bacterium AL-N5]NOK85173.1 hypothetical protein [Chloroflexi bacterium AL-W]NOK92162.1 hypothetical protein [Chloroflexi bacterium AL-N15]